MSQCKDCKAEGITTARVLATRRDGTLEPGPRCVTHQRRIKKERSERNHARRTEQTYGITGDEYWELYRSQDGVCAICRRATGQRKRLAVDHNHETGAVRGLLCGPCNRDLIGVYTEDALIRAILYVRNEPAQEVLRKLRDEKSI